MTVPAQPNLKLVNAPDYREAYANSEQMRVNVWDFFMVFGTLQQQTHLSGRRTLLPKERILHCHSKNVARNADGKLEWSPVDIGFIDWPAQYRALKAIGYRNAISLETHWRGAGTPEASSRISWAGMKKSLEAANAF